MAVLILDVNTLYRLFCLFRLFLMLGKGLVNSLLTSRNCGLETSLAIANWLSNSPMISHVRTW